jgi:hypothetical protein
MSAELLAFWELDSDSKKLVEPFGDLDSEQIIPKKPLSFQQQVKSKRASARRLAKDMRKVNRKKTQLLERLLLEKRRLVVPFVNGTERVLAENGQRIVRKFGNNLNRSLKPTLRLSDADQRANQKRLQAFAAKNAKQAARATGRTDLKAMRRANKIADAERRRLRDAGKEMTDEQHAKFARKKFEKNLRGRVGGQATLQSTTLAEGSKQIELDTFKKQMGDVDLMKRWDSQGDIRTRSTHLAADSQVVVTTDPFLVGGFQLMYPGDGSLGAPMKERARCRCASFVDPGQVEEQLSNTDPTPPTTFTPPPTPKGKKKTPVSKGDARKIGNAQNSVDVAGKYTLEELEAVEEYAGHGFAIVNQHLRHGVGGKFGVPRELLSEARDLRTSIRSALMKTKLKRGGDVWRGCNSRRVGNMVRGLKPGDLLPSKGFTSASVSRDIANKFSGGLTAGRPHQQRVMMKINMKKGQHAISPDRVGKDFAADLIEEGELVLSDKGRFKVKRVWEGKLERPTGRFADTSLTEDTLFIELDYMDDISGKALDLAEVIDLKADEDEVEVVIRGETMQRMYWSDQEAWGMVEEAGLCEAQRAFLAAEETA